MAKLVKKVTTYFSDEINEADAAEETREQSVEREPQAHPGRGPKGHRRLGPRAQQKSAKETKPAKAAGPAPRHGGPANMGWRWRGDGGARIRPPCEPRVCSWCPRLAESPPAHHRLRSSSSRNRYCTLRRTPASGSSGSPVTKLLQCSVLPRALGLGAMHIA